MFQTSMVLVSIIGQKYCFKEVGFNHKEEVLKVTLLLLLEPVGFEFLSSERLVESKTYSSGLKIVIEDHCHQDHVLIMGRPCNKTYR